MRVFIGIDLDESVKECIANCQKKLKPLAEKGRWKKANSFHLTLRFLGDFDENDLPRLYEALSGCADDVLPFELHLGKLGAFDLKQRASDMTVRVLWIGVDGDMKALNALYFAVNYALERKGFPKDYRPYAPHITLGQDLRFTCTPEIIKQELGCLNQMIRVNEITVFNSELKDGERVYTPLKRFKVGK